MNNIHTHILSNGLRVIYKRIDSPVSYLGLAIKAGSRDEGRLHHGLAHLVEHMLFKGTTSRSSVEIIQALEGVGGELNAYTTKEDTTLYAIFPQTYRPESMALLSDIAWHSTMPEEELAKERTVIIDEIASYEDSPSDLIFDEFEDLLFSSHPLGHAILGKEASIKRINSRTARSFVERYYKPKNMVLFAQSAEPFEVILRELEQHFAAELEGASPERITSSPSRREPRRITRGKGTSQRHVLIGGLAYPRGDKRRLPLSLLVNLLGGPSMNSRLNLSLREQEGLVYHVECSYTAWEDAGMIAIYFGCSSENQASAIALVEAELSRLVNEPLSQEELTAAKLQLKGQLTVATDHRENAFLSMGKNFLHYGRVETLEELCHRIDAIEADELHGIARELLPPEGLHHLIYK